jgi:hypothetical protein
MIFFKSYIKKVMWKIGNAVPKLIVKNDANGLRLFTKKEEYINKSIN